MPAPTSDRAGIRQTVRALRAADHTLDHVFDGGDNVPVRTETEVIDAVEAVDDAYLNVVLPNGDTGWVRFVLGNEPDEVICDHTVNLSPVLDPLTNGWYFG